MRRFFMGFALLCAVLAVPAALTAPAQAEIFIAINKSAQSMSVVVDGRERYRWPVSTGRDGGPPSGAYRPRVCSGRETTRMHRSRRDIPDY